MSEPPAGAEPRRSPRALAPALRLVVITDEGMAAPRPWEEVVEAALAGGAPSVQLRCKELPARELLARARVLREMSTRAGALLFVNDRADVALCAGADGVHVGPQDPPVAALRRWVPDGFLIGYSTDDPAEARRAEADGADYLGCGAVWRTATKNVADEAIGVDGLEAVCRAVEIPVVAIGGITPARAVEVAATGAAGVAVVGAVMAAADPAAAVRALLEPFQA